MYFQEFPSMLYEFDIKNKPTALVVKDITRNVRFRRDVLANITVYDEYDIMEGETPEHISEKMYGTPYYYWIIMLSNERYDYIKDFPLTYYQLERYISDKYGEAIYDIHHFENSKGFVVNSDYSGGAISVSNYRYEELINESKRRIKIIPNNMIDLILKNFKDLI